LDENRAAADRRKANRYAAIKNIRVQQDLQKAAVGQGGKLLCPDSHTITRNCGGDKPDDEIERKGLEDRQKKKELVA